MEMKTASLSHSSSADWHDVYEPAEDSFLLIDALEADLPLITQRSPCLCLEVGSGSGVVITSLSGALKPTTHCVATDINPAACRMSQRTAAANAASVDVLHADLAPLRAASVDLVVFNPPYVLTPSQEVSGGGIERSWAGGLRGREVVDRFLQLIVPLLSPRGLGYLLLLQENDPSDVADILHKMGCASKQIAARRLRGEYLVVLRFEKES